MTPKSLISVVAVRAAVALSAAAIGFAAPVPSARADTFGEMEANDTKATANAVNLGTATTATITGSSPNNAAASADYFKITTAYTTPGIYLNQLQLANGTQNIGSLRALTQASGTITAGTDALFQSSPASGTPMPYGLSQYYSFGGAGKTQSMYYKVSGASSSTGGDYTSNFTSSRITPNQTGTNLRPGVLNFSAQANVGSSGVASNTEIVVLDSNFNVYIDNVSGSSTNGYAANNDNGSNGFNLTRQFSPGTYYIAISISNVATDDAAPPDELATSRNNPVLDFDNVIATNNTFYNGNNGNTRPADFIISDGNGNAYYTSSGQVIGSLYALNFYSFTVVPEPATWLSGALTAGLLGWGVRRRRSIAVGISPL